MLVFLLLLVFGVAGEWVEIVQNQQGQEPSRRFTHDRGTEAKKIYANYSSTESSWRRTVLTRTPNFGNVKRVQLKNKEVGIFTAEVLSGLDEKSYENGQYQSSGAVRAPSVKLKENFDYNHEKTDFNADVVEHNFGKVSDKSTISLHKPLLYINDLGNNKIYTKNDIKFKPNIVATENNNFQEIVKSRDRDYKTGGSDQRHPNLRRVQSGSDVNYAKTVQVKKSDKDPEQDSDKVNNNTNIYRIKHMNETFKTAFVTLLEGSVVSFQDPYSAKPVTKHKYHMDKNANKQIYVQNVTKLDETRKAQETIKAKEDHLTEPGENINQNVLKHSKTNTVDVIWKIMKLVTDNISSNTRRSFRSKVGYLESLRNNIISNIEERIEQAWPDDEQAPVETGGGRSRRSPRGHVEFPSSESALMTISFLTFAVFLIKLVLQVIHTYKNKTMMVTPAVVAAVGRAAAALRDRTRH